MFRESDLDEHLETPIDRKREALFLLYLYHENYKEQDDFTKRSVRDFYETQLRYKGSFYRDKKTFEEKGNPLEWSDKKVNRYKVEEQSYKYYRGMDTYDTFTYSSSNLVLLELVNHLNLLILEDGEILSSNYDYIITTELENMMNAINELDTRKKEVMLKKGFNPLYNYTLDDLRVTFVLQINDYVTYISTPFMKRRYLIDKAINVLNSHFWSVTRLESFGSKEFNERYEYEEEFRAHRIEIIDVIISKKTDLYNLKLEGEKRYKDYDIQYRTLTSIEIKEVFH